MLRELRVRGLGVIDDVSVELADGLTVVTGETGAGKTLIVTGLSLLCGARADTALVREGADAAIIEARVDGEGDEDVVSRHVRASGNRIRIHGEMGTVAALREWADDNVEIHAQHEHLRLAEPAIQRRLLDGWVGADHEAVVHAHERAWRGRSESAAEREVLLGDERVRLRLADQLRHELAEIEGAAIDIDADAALEGRLVLLESAEEVLEHLAEAASALGEDGASEPLGTAVAALRRLPSSATLDDLVGRAIQISEDASDLARDLFDAAEDADVDEAELERVRERVRLLSDLRRKYGDDLETVIAHGDEARQRLGELDGHDDRVRELDRRLARLDEQLAASAEQIREGRTSAAGRLAAAIDERLPALGMPHARFTVDVDPAPLGPAGSDEVSWRVQTNPDAPAVTLGKGASGGERSRVALAVETVLADADQAGTIVFDEVDAGVSGETAMAVGAALAELAHARPDRQVLCVTHLAQVAAFADVHHVVTKDVEDGRTIVRATRVAGDQRAEALARMMGSADSEASIAHARELLDAAARRVEQRPPGRPRSRGEATAAAR